MTRRHSTQLSLSQCPSTHLFELVLWQCLSEYVGQHEVCGTNLRLHLISRHTFSHMFMVKICSRCDLLFDDFLDYAPVVHLGCPFDFYPHSCTALRSKKSNENFVQLL
jgi:hypothetical protein